MARAPTSGKFSSDIDTINLSRALSRLEHKILSPDADPRLKKSSYERTKTSANVEYARDLLLRLEHNASSIKVQSRKQAVQTTLQQQRALIKRLNDRLYELSQQDDGNLSSASDSDEDLLGEDAPPPPSSSFSSPTRAHRQADALSTPEPLETETTSTLRARLLPTSHQASTTAHSLISQPDASSFTSHPSSSSPSPTATTLLEADTATQETLTASMLALASALKQSSLALSASLAADDITLDSTNAALDKNSDGMSTATKRIGTLRGMSEGRWWWGRMLLYACIAGLWVLALGIVFVGPKLRF